MPALPSVRARPRARPRPRTCAGPASRRIGALAGVLTLVLATAPLAAQTALPEAPPDAPAETPAEPTADATADAATAPTPAVGDLSTRRSLAWIAIGAAAAFATTSAVLALSVESREDDLAFLIDFRAPGVDVPSRYDGQVRDRYEQLAGEARTLSRYSWLTLGLAVASVASATALFLLDDAGARAEAPASGRSHLAPTLLPGGMAVTLDWEF